MIKLKAKINKLDKSKQNISINIKKLNKPIQKINVTKIWFFEKIILIDKPLAKLTKKWRKKIHINKIRDEKGW